MRITTKKLIMISIDMQGETFFRRWALYTRKKKGSEELGTEIAKIYFNYNCEKRKNEVILDADIVNEEYFDVFGAQGIRNLLKKYIFRQKDIYFVRHDMKSKSVIMAVALEKVGFTRIEGTNSWVIEKPAPYYTLMFIMLGGMCGLSFGRNFTYPFLMVIAGFVLGFLIGFPLDKKDKVARK